MAFGSNFNMNKLKKGLSKTREKLFGKIAETMTGRAKLDEETLESLEEILISSDIGFDTALDIIEQTRDSLMAEKDRSEEKIFEILERRLRKILQKYEDEVEIKEEIEKYKPYVILVVGVNGVGKTTTIGKLAHNFKESGLKVVIGSADTFRAAANEQLDVWAERAGVKIVSSKHGEDPSSVAFDTLQQAVREKADVVLIDTAGRLHTKNNLMEELSKIKRVLKKVLDYAPNETLLVIDGSTGQNGLVQAKEFAKYTELSGLIITKLDGTAKGGIVFQICSELKIPIRYIGVGEGINDLQTFSPSAFAKAFFDRRSNDE